ncbi:CDP-diacylglycerol--glycerol-3-phosphate 3-phosphatidyltransferase [bacterium]|nr:CDP-diacylglycerol--glycerol-3-phosphate 3-phosphatidyltransferase [bacterium]
MNISNKLTLTRIILIPIFIILLINQYTFFALAVFGLAAITDALDGMLARARNQKTMLGFFLDPVADKLLINASIIALAGMKLVPVWIAVVIVSRDVLIAIGFTSVYIINDKIFISPTNLSKATTTVQMLTVMIALLSQIFDRFYMLLWVFVWVCAAFTIASGFDYIYIVAKMVNGEK